MRMGECEEIVHCRLCSGSRLSPVLDLGNQPLPNRLLRSDSADRTKWYPLRLVRCDACGFVQTLHAVPVAEVLAGEAPDKQAAPAVVASLLARGLASPGDVVVDIGCGDGSLLTAWGKDIHALGIEAHRASATAAAKRGLAVHCEAFTAKTAADVANDYNGARVITAIDVLQRERNPEAFLMACVSLLRGDGRLVVEVPDWGQVEADVAVDRIDHRTQSWFTIQTLYDMMKRCGLRIIDASLVPDWHKTLHVEAVTDPRTAASGSVSALLASDYRNRDRDRERSEGLQAAFERLRTNVCETVNAFDRVAGYGSPDRAAVITNVFGLGKDNLDWVASPVEGNGRILPGSCIPVVPLSRLSGDRQPELMLLFDREDRSAVIRGEVRYRGKWLIPVPHAEVV